MNSKFLGIVGACAAVAFAAPACATTFVSFENPSLGTGSSAYAYASQPGGGFPSVPSGFAPIPGVTFSGASGIQANGSAWNFSSAPDGTQTAFVQDYNGTAGAITIALTGLTQNQRYFVNFEAAARNAGLANPFILSTSVGTIGSYSITGTAFGLYQTSFVAGGTSDFLTFTGSAAPGDSSFALDAITVAVPEPATWALMITGFGLIGFAMRRRRQDVRVRFAI
jgi:hypothetical protein